ncbi:hypothetical protein H1Y97_004329 [Escherichia coli]|nr:hypothetical protein [Escherichia coli]
MNTTMVAADSDLLVMEHFIKLVHTYTLKQSYYKNPIYGYLKANIERSVVKMWYDDGYRRYLKIIHPKELMITMDIGDFVKDKVESIIRSVVGEYNPIVYGAFVQWKQSSKYYFPNTPLTLTGWISVMHSGVFLEASETMYKGYILPHRLVKCDHRLTVGEFRDILEQQAEDLQGEIEEFLEEHKLK